MNDTPSLLELIEYVEAIIRAYEIQLTHEKLPALIKICDDHLLYLRGIRSELLERSLDNA